MSTYPFIGKSGFGATPTLTISPAPSSGDTRLYLNPNDILAVEASGSGAKVYYIGRNDMQLTQVVSETPAAIAAQIGLVELTQAGDSASRFYPLTAIHGRATRASTAASVQISPYINQDTKDLPVTESLATVEARITAAMAIAGGGGSTTFASYTAAGTNQATATATTTGEIRITGGAVNTGVVLDGATGGEQRKIYNATSTLKFVYPAVGEFIDPAAVNVGITLGPGEGIFLSANLAAHWSRYENEFHQFVAGSGTAQLGGQISVGVQDVTITSAGIGNTAVTLPLGTVGYRITVSNTTATNVRLYPFTGDAITTNGADNFINFQAGRQVELIMDVAGTWLFADSQFETIAVSTINTLTTGGTTAFADPIAGNNATFSNQGNAMQRGLALFQATGTATAGGVQADGVQVSSNIFDITVCATAGDSATLTAVSDIVLVRNSGVADCYLYCPVGQSMDGVTDGYVVINPGATVLVAQTVAATRWVSTRIEGDRVASFAAAGILQGTATAIPLNVDYAIVTTATAGVDDGVILPAATVGLKKTVLNQTADIVQLWPFTGGQVLAQGVNTAYALGPNESVALECLATGTWVQASNSFMSIFTDMIDEAVAGNGITLSHQVVLSLATLVGQDPVTTAIAVTNVVQATYAAATEGIRLGDRSNWYNIYTNSASGGLVYPPTGGTINGAAVDAAIFLPQGFEAMLVSTNSLNFEARIQFRDIEQGQTLTANAVQTQATGTKVGAKYTIAGTVTTALDAFTLDPRTGVKELVFFNNAGVSCSLFPPVGGTIDGGAVDAVFVVPRSCAFLLTTDDGLDYKVFLLPGATQVASADAGSSQATGTPIVGPTVNCTVVTTAGDAYTIQTYTPRVFQIWNRDSTDSLDLFPPVGGTINGGAANIAFAIPAGVGFKVYSNDGATWLVQLLDGSAQSATASAGSDQATGTAITSTTVNATTVATAGDSYTIQAWSPKLFRIWNRDATEALDLFPPVGGTIDGAAANIAFSIPAGSGWILTSNDGATWLVELIPAATQTATANTGSDQATGTPILSPSVTAATVANAGDSFTIRAWSPRWFELFNDGANAADVFPPVGGTINGGAADAAFSVAVGVGFRFSSNDGIAWTIALMENARQVATANVGSNQATGEPIVSPTVNATTVANAGDAYSIQTYSPRLFQIWNRGANSLDLFPPVGGTINGLGANLAFAIPAGIGFKVVSNDGADWLVELLPGGAQASTANVGSDQATGEPVVGSVECLVCANAGDSYSIQTWSPRFFHIRNSGGNSLDLFPPVGGQINGGGANVALAVAAAAAYIVYSNDGVLWYAIVQ